MHKKTIVTVTGIRPDFIRMSEIIRRLDEEPTFKHVLIHTGQHYDEILSGVFFKDLDIRKPDHNLGIGGSSRSHYHQQAQLSVKIIELLEKHDISPDIVLFLGDSNSVLASVPLRKQGYKIGHIEAGMRSYDERMLEEINRKVCDHVSNVLFVYHENYKKKAMREGILADKIFVVGNTIVEPLKRFKSPEYQSKRSHITMDIHRPENFQHKERLQKIFDYANEYARKFSLPVKMISFGRTMLAIKEYNINIGKVECIPMMGYKEYIRFQEDSLFVISDSGTAQEEAPFLGVPVIIPRDFTERPESIENNCSFMLLLNNHCYQESVDWLNNYDGGSIEWLGDGTTSQKVLDILKEIL